MTIKLLMHRSVRDHCVFVDLFEDAVHFAVDSLGIRSADWRVEIRFVDQLESLQNLGPAMGRCDTLVASRVSKIYISTKNRGAARTLTTLFHELTHVRQLVAGDVKIVGQKVFLWKNSQLFREPHSYMSYWNSPDEIDARRYERILLRKYAMDLIKQKIVQWFSRWRKPLTEEQLDWQYNDRKSSYAEMQARRDNMSNPGDKDYEL